MIVTTGRQEEKIVAIKSAVAQIRTLPANPASVPALRQEVRQLQTIVRALCDLLGFDPGDLTPEG